MVLTTFVCLLFMLPLQAQPLLNRQYNINFLDLTSGLPQNNVNHIFADSYGFIWISTYGGGAVRYDGYSFVSPVFNSPKGFVSNSCKGFAEDKSQRLWIAYDEGTVVLDMRTMQRVTPQDKRSRMQHLQKTTSGTLQQTVFSTTPLTKKAILPILPVAATKATPPTSALRNWSRTAQYGVA